MHAALVYSGPEEFLAGALPYIREGLRDGDQVFAVVDADTERLLRDAIATGPPAGSVEFVDSTAWYTTPGRTMFAYDEYMRDQEEQGRRVRIIGEPVWEGRTSLQQQAWQRYESVLNAAMAARDVSLVCPYDAQRLDPALVAVAARTHPLLLGARGTEPSAGYLDPRTFGAELDREPLPPPVARPTRFDFDAYGLSRSRQLVTRLAEDAGVSPARVTELVVAVNEITTNAVRHGGGRGQLRAWREDHSLVFEVADSGSARPDPLAGYVRPSDATDQVGGYGLWMAHQLCDQVEVRHGPGWLVRLYADLPSA